jgi:hypothetical protein
MAASLFTMTRRPPEPMRMTTRPARMIGRPEIAREARAS